MTDRNDDWRKSGKGQAPRAVGASIDLDASVENLELSIRAANCMKNAEVRTLRDLVRKTEWDLLSTKRFGRKSLKEVKEVLLELGLALGMIIDDSVRYLPGTGTRSSRPEVRGSGVTATVAQGREPRSAGAAGASDPPESVGWRTTDEDEVKRRVERAEKEPMDICLVPGTHPLFGTFTVTRKGTQRIHQVEIRSLAERENTCDCPDFRINGLGLCKHVEAVMLHLKRRHPAEFRRGPSAASRLLEVYLSRSTEPPSVRVSVPDGPLELVQSLSEFFSASGTLLADPVEAVPSLHRAVARLPESLRGRVRISREVDDWVASERRKRERGAARQAFVDDVAAGKRTIDPPGITLYPYQRDGALHLAFGERAMLADEMGLGKTVQAVVACDILRQTRRIERVLVVAPVSLKSEWEEQIRKFSHHSTQIIIGPRAARLRQYRNPTFFNLANYEQMLADQKDVVEVLAPDVVILDEAQRIKNWQTKIAHTIKGLSSPFAFVLTGTPLENRIDEVYSLVEFLDPMLFGPLFRFNREYYQLDDRGRPAGYKNIDKLHRTVRSVMLRRRKDEVEDQLPERQLSNYFVPMESEQRVRYEEVEAHVARIMQIAKRRPLRPEEFDRLQQKLACMRMICDSPYILDQECRIAPKIDELSELVESALDGENAKIIIFSEWERMLHLVRERMQAMKLDPAWHTGSVPQAKRRVEINRFKNDDDCRVFLSTDSGATGLNLQVANTVINMDLPWNPAKLEQRIGRAWRKFQTRSVQVLNLVAENSIEHRMLGTLQFKQELADGVLDGRGDLDTVSIPSGRAAFMERLESIMGGGVAQAARTVPERLRPERTGAPIELFRQDLAARLADRLLLLEMRQRPDGGAGILAVVDGNPAEISPTARRLLADAWHGAGAPPDLEVIDRATFDLLRRLAGSGLFQFPSGGGTRLHAVGPFEQDAADLARQRRETARRLLAATARERKLAAVMAAGGFPAEALVPTLKAVETALRASAHASLGRDAGNAAPLADAEVGQLLTADNSLSPSTATLVARLRTATSAGDCDDEAASALLVEAERFLAEVSRTLGMS
ncbi:MAG: hypothetical protein FJ109_08140 [Deltaproteobacteria bacterium]|nr:hypothetical protein [Deltaproteobacteria bacterium]